MHEFTLSFKLILLLLKIGPSFESNYSSNNQHNNQITIHFLNNLCLARKATMNLIQILAKISFQCLRTTHSTGFQRFNDLRAIGSPKTIFWETKTCKPLKIFNILKITFSLFKLYQKKWCFMTHFRSSSYNTNLITKSDVYT